MDQLLDRDGQQDPPMLEVIEHSMNEQNYDVDDTQHDSQVVQKYLIFAVYEFLDEIFFLFVDVDPG